MGGARQLLGNDDEEMWQGLGLNAVSIKLSYRPK